MSVECDLVTGTYVRLPGLDYRCGIHKDIQQRLMVHLIGQVINGHVVQILLEREIDTDVRTEI